MVFVKFHNMKQENKIMMSPLNSNKLSFLFSNKFDYHSQQVKTILTNEVHKCSVVFSFFSIYALFIFLKMFVFSFSLWCIRQCSSFFSFPLCPFPLSCTFFFKILKFFYNKFLIRYFFKTLYLLLSVFTLI